MSVKMTQKLACGICFTDSVFLKLACQDGVSLPCHHSFSSLALQLCAKTILWVWSSLKTSQHSNHNNVTSLAACKPEA